jgi:predicted membrane chloride channel (bestrophin family)
VQTPVPLSYARHTSRFLTFWLWTLPFVLVNDLGFWHVHGLTDDPMPVSQEES